MKTGNGGNFRSSASCIPGLFFEEDLDELQLLRLNILYKSQIEQVLRVCHTLFAAYNFQISHILKTRVAYRTQKMEVFREKGIQLGSEFPSVKS